MKLKPFNAAPKRAKLLNTGRPVKFVVNLTPADHAEQKAYLRLMHLPANAMSNTVLVVKLEFDRDPATAPPPAGNMAVSPPGISMNLTEPLILLSTAITSSSCLE